MTFYLLESLCRGSYIEAHWQINREGGSFGVQGFLPLEGEALPSLLLNEDDFIRLVDSEERLAALVGTGMAILRYDEAFGGTADALAEMIVSGGDEFLARIEPRRMIFGMPANNNEVRYGV